MVVQVELVILGVAEVEVPVVYFQLVLTYLHQLVLLLAEEVVVGILVEEEVVIHPYQV